jgi:ArsR family transcriptional regulator, lead/cadmium/zinc/bismuth-responsive transcriptional repressor
LTPGHSHRARRLALVPDAARARTANLFRALGDPERLKLIELLARDEWCVSELAEAVAGDPTTLSQRLRVLRHEGLVHRRRNGRHIFYRLSDDHVADLVRNGFAHAQESFRRAR